LRKGEILFSALAIVVSVYFYVESTRFSAGKESFYLTGFYTQFLAISLAILVGLLLTKNSRFFSKRREEDKQTGKTGGRRLNVALLFTIGVLIASPAILKYIGFLLGGGLFLVSTMSVLTLSVGGERLDHRNILKIMFISAGVLGSIYLLFQLILTIPLPEGPWVF
jgi:hypothetical protein